MSGEKVWLSRCGGYRPEELLAQVEEAFAALGVWEELKPGMQVVLKPNLVISAKPEAAIATHPGLVAAVGRCVQKAGGQVIIAESPGGPYTPAAMKAVFRGCGYTEMAKECGFTLYTGLQKPGGLPAWGGALPPALRGGAVSHPGLSD